MSAGAPFDFGHYKEWRRTRLGREWFRHQAEKDCVCYHCDQCGDEVWVDKGAGLLSELRCPYPCDGMKRPLKPAEFWEE